MLDALARALNPLWRAMLTVLDAIFSVVVSIINAVVILIIDLLVLLMTALLSLIPELPPPDQTDLGSALGAIYAANKYLPLTETIALLPVLATVFAVIGAYKLAKFVRGGG